MFWLIVLSAVLGYFLGAVPVGYLVGRLYGVDVREHGSGRTGGTNVWRAVGLTAAIITVVGDALKGILAVVIARQIAGGELAPALAGAAAVMGHNWPIFLRFRGGAGGMTGVWALLGLNLIAGAVVAPLALLAVYFTRFASVGTLTVGFGSLVVLAAFHFFIPPLSPTEHLVYGFSVAAMVVIALRPNIHRLLQGTERRITLW